MTSITHVNQIIQIDRVRSSHLRTAKLVNKDGSLRRRDKTVVAHFPPGTAGLASPGTLWRIDGIESEVSFTTKDRFIEEYEILITNAKYLKPSGQVMARWIAGNIESIGSVIAARLSRTENLPEIVKKRDRLALLSVKGMNDKRVDNLLNSWPGEELYEVIDWLQEKQLPLDIATRMVNLFGEKAIDKVIAHPFLLMSMGVSFEQMLSLISELGLTLDSDDVLAGIAQYAAIRAGQKSGSTVVSGRDLSENCSKILRKPVPKNIGEIAVQKGLLVHANSGYQVYGAALMEVTVANFLMECSNREPGNGSLDAGWEFQLSERNVRSALEQYEESLDFRLTMEQRDAVVGSVMSPVCGISGGAGTGKTTILRAILGVYSELSDTPCYQVALSGRAAQRMAESTGRPAQTIAKLWFSHSGDKSKGLPSHLILVIDESSMVDLTSMYRLIGILPPASRIIMVGDVVQLPPVGPGLIFHCLADTGIPFFELTLVKRQSAQSPIHRLATAIRNAEFLDPTDDNSGCLNNEDCHLSSGMNEEDVLNSWRELGCTRDTIVLTPVKDGELGVKNLNNQIQRAVGLDRQLLTCGNSVHSGEHWITAWGSTLREGDSIMVTANNYDEEADVRNGDLGHLLKVYQPNEGQEALGLAEFNGVVMPIKKSLAEKLELGYAVTVHKSQGSQWHNCILALPDSAEKMLDQTLLYTAITRAQKRLVIHGEISTIHSAVEKGSLALNRLVGLRERLNQAQTLVCDRADLAVT